MFHYVFDIMSPLFSLINILVKKWRTLSNFLFRLCYYICTTKSSELNHFTAITSHMLSSRVKCELIRTCDAFLTVRNMHIHIASLISISSLDIKKINGNVFICFIMISISIFSGKQKIKKILSQFLQTILKKNPFSLNA